MIILNIDCSNSLVKDGDFKNGLKKIKQLFCCGRQNNGPKAIYILSPGTCDYVILNNKGKL